MIINRGVLMIIFVDIIYN